MGVLTVKTWGAGGSGGKSGTGNASGGGGGAFSKKDITTTLQGTYSIQVGDGGAAKLVRGTVGSAGEDSWFGDASTVMAKGGSGGNIAGPNDTIGATAGGQASASIGDTKYDGGDGGAVSGTAGNGEASGGGGGAGDTGAGGDAVTAADGQGGTAGGTGTSDGGGNGGAGGIPTGANGSNAGGGGGACSNSNSDVAQPSGAGARGEVRVSYPDGTFTATGGSSASAGGVTTHTFTADGTFEITSVAFSTAPTDTLALVENPIVNMGYMLTVSDTLSLTDVIEALKGMWRNLTKNSATFTNTTKNSISPTNTSKNSSSWVNTEKSL